MFKILIGLILLFGLCSGGALNAHQNDQEILDKISAGWQAAFQASRAISTFEVKKKIQRSNQDGWTERWFFQTKGLNFVQSVSQSGTEHNPKVPYSFIRMFNGNYSAAIGSQSRVTGPFNSDTLWGMSDLVMGPNPDNRSLEMLRTAAEAGVYLSNAPCLSFFLPQQEHISIDNLSVEIESGRELIRMEFRTILDRVDGKKYMKPKPPKGVFWLDPKTSYLPVRFELPLNTQFSSVDQFEYQANGDSFYVKKIVSDLSFFREDGTKSTWLVESEVTIFSDEVPSDEVFRLSHYGLTEPEVVGEPRRISWYLIVLGLVIVTGVLVGRRLLTRNE